MSGDPAATARFGRLVQACLLLSSLSMVAMVVLISAEVIARSFFHYSFEIVDEVGAYLLVAVSFLALAPAQAAGSFHSVELIQERLSARAQRIWQRVFLTLSLVFALTMLGTITRYVWRTWQQSDVASTVLQTPLWIPQSVMIVGMACLCVVLVQKLRNVRASGDAP
ncbi:MAG: TRAP transporter small permease [Comamonadaceae bacterium]|nr:MAG: TRAP transporter small permease [Comamonadaceae bacterium]